MLDCRTTHNVALLSPARVRHAQIGGYSPPPCRPSSLNSGILPRLNIPNSETETLADALAKLTGETKTQAVTRALRDRLEQVQRQRSGRRLAGELDEIALHTASLPILDDRSVDDILGFDEHGLPR